MKQSPALFVFLFVFVGLFGVYGCKKKSSPAPAMISPLTISFTGMRLPGNAITFKTNAPSGYIFSWDFGDSTGSTNYSPSHSYAIPGFYYVQLHTYCATNDSTYFIIIWVSIANDPGITRSLAGTRNWTSYYEYAHGGVKGRSPANDSTFSINYIDDLTLSIGDYTLYCLPNCNGDTLQFGESTVGAMNGNGAYLTYYKADGRMEFYYFVENCCGSDSRYFDTR